MIIYSLPFLEMLPEYTCTDVTTGDTFDCTPMDFCVNPDLTYEPNFDKPTSLNNWMVTLDLPCSDPAEFGMIGASYFIGMVISLIFMPRIADLYGRKNVIAASHFIQIAILPVLISMTNLMTAYLSYFVLGLGFAGSLSVSAIYI